MDKQEKAQIILKEVDETYCIPTYMEEYVKRAIVRALTKIEKEEGAEIE